MTDLDKVSKKLGELEKKLEGEPKQFAQTLREYEAYFEGVCDNEEDEVMKKDMSNLITFFKMCSEVVESAEKLGELDSMTEPLNEILNELKKLETEIDDKKPEEES